MISTHGEPSPWGPGRPSGGWGGGKAESAPSQPTKEAKESSPAMWLILEPTTSPIPRVDTPRPPAAPSPCTELPERLTKCFYWAAPHAKEHGPPEWAPGVRVVHSSLSDSKVPQGLRTVPAGCAEIALNSMYMKMAFPPRGNGSSVSTAPPRPTSSSHTSEPCKAQAAGGGQGCISQLFFFGGGDHVLQGEA